MTKLNETLEHAHATSGSWGRGSSWRFVDGVHELSDQLVSAVFSLALAEDALIFTRNQRARWELLGGHIEPGESIEQALCREALEEGGVNLDYWSRFGHIEVQNDGSAINPSTQAPYAPLGYVLFFVGISARPLMPPTGIEVTGVSRVPLAQLQQLAELQGANLEIIHRGLLVMTELLEKQGVDASPILKYLATIL